MIFVWIHQVMETKNMLYLVTEYAKNGEIFGKFIDLLSLYNCVVSAMCFYYAQLLQRHVAHSVR